MQVVLPLGRGLAGTPQDAAKARHQQAGYQTHAAQTYVLNLQAGSAVPSKLRRPSSKELLPSSSASGPDLTASFRGLPPPVTSSCRALSPGPAAERTPRQRSLPPEANPLSRSLRGLPSGHFRPSPFQTCTSTGQIVAASGVDAEPVNAFNFERLKAEIKEELAKESAIALSKMRDDLRAEICMLVDELQCSLEEFASPKRASQRDEEQPRHMEAIVEKLNVYHENALGVNDDVTRLSVEAEALRKAVDATEANLNALQGQQQADFDERLARALEADHAAQSEALSENMGKLQGKLDGELATLREEAASAGRSVAQLNVESATLRSQLCELCALLTGEAEEMSRQVISIEVSSEAKHAELQKEQDLKLGNMDIKIEHLTTALANEEMALEEAVETLQAQLPNDRSRRNSAQSSHGRIVATRAGATIRGVLSSGTKQPRGETRLATNNGQDEVGRLAAALEKVQQDSDVRVTTEAQKREAAEAAVLQLTAELSALRSEMEAVAESEAKARAAKPVVLSEERSETVIEQREMRSASKPACVQHVTVPLLVATAPAVVTAPPQRLSTLPSVAGTFQRPPPVQVQRATSFTSQSPSPPCPQSPRSPPYRVVAASFAPVASPERPSSTTTTTQRTMKVTRSLAYHGSPGNGGSGQFSAVGVGQLENGGVALPASNNASL